MCEHEWKGRGVIVSLFLKSECAACETVRTSTIPHEMPFGQYMETMAKKYANAVRKNHIYKKQIQELQRALHSSGVSHQILTNNLSNERDETRRLRIVNGNKVEEIAQMKVERLLSKPHNPAIHKTTVSSPMWWKWQWGG